MFAGHQEPLGLCFRFEMTPKPGLDESICVEKTQVLSTFGDSPPSASIVCACLAEPLLIRNAFDTGAALGDSLGKVALKPIACLIGTRIIHKAKLCARLC
jgi:hypothetical protein